MESLALASSGKRGSGLQSRARRMLGYSPGLAWQPVGMAVLHKGGSGLLVLSLPNTMDACSLF